jgi:hypothetical protein
MKRFSPLTSPPHRGRGLFREPFGFGLRAELLSRTIEGWGYFLDTGLVALGAGISSWDDEKPKPKKVNFMPTMVISRFPISPGHPKLTTISRHPRIILIGDPILLKGGVDSRSEALQE